MSKATTATAAKRADDKNPATMQPVKKDNGTKAKTPAKEAPLSERIKNARQQADLVEKWESLQAYRKELDSFKFGGDGVRQGLTITDGEREFRSTRTEHLETVVSVLIDRIDEKIEEVEKLIK